MKKQNVIIILALVTVCCALLYCILLNNTNSVIDDFKDVVSNSMKSDIEYGALKDRYDIGKHFDFVNVDIEIKRNFVIHNFNKGVMYVNYTYYAYDSNDDIVAGSHNAPSKWYIEKKEGRWLVTKIEERP